MVKKFDVITKLYEEATQEVTESPEKWLAFLQSASKNYRLPFCFFFSGLCGHPCGRLPRFGACPLFSIGALAQEHPELVYRCSFAFRAFCNIHVILLIISARPDTRTGAA